jgi:hypothetical protein
MARSVLLVVLPSNLGAPQLDASKKTHRTYLAFPYGVLTIASYLKRFAAALGQVEILDLNLPRAFKELVERLPGQAFAHYFLARCDDLLAGDGSASYRRYEQIVAESPVWREAAERFGLEIEHDDTAASDRAAAGRFRHPELRAHQRV